jgi:pyridoxal phosphate enzyme (YggS family)
MSIAANLSAIKNELGKSTKLVAISKTKPVALIMECYTAGQRAFGENKVQELVEKYAALPKDIEWHLVGHLQSNKVKFIAPFVSLIHSVDSFKLLYEINKQGEKINRVIPCLLQMYIATEETKFGLSEPEVFELLQNTEFRLMRNIRIDGLMGMATNTTDEVKVRSEFRNLKVISERVRKKFASEGHPMREVSMGMSGDYHLAVQEGSTMVRVGSSIFGERKG